MRTTIEELWNGNIMPSRNCGEYDAEIRELEELIERNREQLEESLNQSQRELLQKLTDCTEEYLCRMTAQAFSDGFSLAGKLLTEALSN